MVKAPAAPGQARAAPVTRKENRNPMKKHLLLPFLLLLATLLPACIVERDHYYHDRRWHRDPCYQNRWDRHDGYRDDWRNRR
ncbi:MAG TPA: hypothetical protein VIL86_07075 [Tepidisphaeraceae bacterium]